MVSKIVKRTPTKKPARRLKRTPTRVSNTVLTSINQSFFTCRRRLIKLFSKLARISSTPIKKPLRKKPAYHLLENSPKRLFYQIAPLPFSLRKTIVLDLDETLIHSRPDPPPESYDFIVKPRIDGEVLTFYVSKRPGLDAFLERVASKFELVVFTAGIKEYASLVLDWIDRKRLISHSLYRDSCKEMEGGKFVKDLKGLGREMNEIVIVDDNPNSVVMNVENAILIKPFVGDEKDDELEKLGRFLEEFETVSDMREIVKIYGHAEKFDYIDLGI